MRASQLLTGDSPSIARRFACRSLTSGNASSSFGHKLARRFSASIANPTQMTFSSSRTTSFKVDIVGSSAGPMISARWEQRMTMDQSAFSRTAERTGSKRSKPKSMPPPSQMSVSSGRWRWIHEAIHDPQLRTNSVSWSRRACLGSPAPSRAGPIAEHGHVQRHALQLDGDRAGRSQ